MTLRREWITPMTAGAFALSAVTGVLMFFHLDTGFNQLAHEWLSWSLLALALLHLTVNFSALKGHLRTRRGQALAGAFLLVLAASFIPAGGKEEPPFLVPVRALAQAPLSTLAQVGKLSPEALNERLAKAGLPPASMQQSVQELVGPDMRRQVRVLRDVLAQ